MEYALREISIRVLPGQYYDAETGLHQNYHRDYDPRTGRYIQPDPIGLAGGSNSFVYVSANPVSLVDPLGLYESHWILRSIVPGQVSFDRGVTNLENGQYGWAVANFGLMVGEQVLYVLTLGESGLGKQATQCALSAEKTVWKVGGHKSATKWANQMARRGWTEQQITEAIQSGQRFPAQNLVNPANSASRYVHPQTGQSVVIDDVTKELLHVGGKGFKY